MSLNVLSMDLTEDHKAVWPAIVIEADHDAARRILTDPARKGSGRLSRNGWCPI